MSRRVVIVDARNVIRSRWPNFAEERFLELARVWADAEGAQLVAVFDGRAPGSRVGSHHLGDGATVVGTGGESADDWIAKHAAGIAGDGTVLWLVTSDRELRERAAEYVERVIGGGSFAGSLEALDS